jgi:hypothetical protein
VINDGDVPRDLSALEVPLLGALEATGDLFEPYRLVDGDGVVVEPARAFFAELAACGRPATTQRSYGMDLLRWFRFLWALGVGWDQATRVEARDFSRWLQVTTKPRRPHWRHPTGGAPGSGTEPAAAETNEVTGKPSRGDRYEATTVAHCGSVLRGFYDFHLEAETGPMLNPFPLSRHSRAGRAHAHHNPMEPIVECVLISCTRRDPVFPGSRTQHTSSALPISSAATRSMICSSSTDSLNIAVHLPPPHHRDRTIRPRCAADRWGHRDKESESSARAHHSWRQQ